METISPWAPPELRVGEYDLFGDHDIQIDETVAGDDEPGPAVPGKEVAR